MPEIRDISGWIYSGMWQYCPEYPGAVISELPHPAFLPPDYPVYLQKFIIGGQTGTYVENRAHVNKAAEPVTALPLSKFYMPAVVINIGQKSANQRITVEDLERANVDLQPGDAALISTGWDTKWNDPDYIEASPYIGREAGLWLIEHKISLLGSDFPRFDYPQKAEFPWNEFWQDVDLILAPVTNISSLSGRCGNLTAFPLKIDKACAVPCRAAIIIEK